MGKKLFLNQTGKTNKPETVNLLGDMLSDDDTLRTKDAEASEENVVPKEIPVDAKAKEENREKNTPAVEYIKSNEINVDNERQYKRKVDKRKVVDKKEVFTSSLRKSIIREIDALMPSYRREIDLDYNFAKFIEDAAKLQIKAMRSAIKK